MDNFTKLIFNNYKKIILEQAPPLPDAGGVPPPDAAGIPPAGAPPPPDTAGAPPPSPGAPPAPDATSAAPVPPAPPVQKDTSKVINNLSLVGVDAFNDWVNASSSQLDIKAKNDLKDAYKRFYDFMKLYKNVAKVIKNTNPNLEEKPSTGETPIENAKL